MKTLCFGLVSGHRFSDAINRSQSTALLGAGEQTILFFRTLLTVAVLALVSLLTAQCASAQEQPAAQPPAQASQPTATEPASAEPAKKEEKQAVPEPTSIGGQLAEETREATGEEEEENANLKHAGPIQWLGRKLGLNVHQAHMLALILNFAIIVAVVLWAAFKFVPGMLRNRNASIQQALEEARAAGQDANRRLAEIENRLRHLDVEIGQMQANAEKEGTAEEVRIQAAAEEDIRKVVLAAEQEIATAAKQARRELSTHTAGLAIALARQRIHVDSNTDEVLVHTFASKLASPPSHKKDDDGGKDGR
ncbi:MAG: ATP synthase F0 subunit B [Acidobacteriia bacterium]|nr:ATP synthase F0 subunit B [Terriglobia bacterium]